MTSTDTAFMATTHRAKPGLRAAWRLRLQAAGALGMGLWLSAAGPATAQVVSRPVPGGVASIDLGASPERPVATLPNQVPALVMGDAVHRAKCSAWPIPSVRCAMPSSG